MRTSLKRILFIGLVVYVLLVGATFNGILNSGLRLISVVGLSALLLIWLGVRWRAGWHWYATALDWVMPIWIVAFALSLLGNLDSWRRISIGLWYVGLYIAVWYVLQDVFANRGLRREWLVDALLIAGVPVVFVGYAQVELALTSGLPLPRPVGTLGNANSLGALLVLLLPLIAGQLKGLRNPLTRMLLLVYGLAVVILLGLSFSRGGWIGGVVALVVWAALSLPLRRWWARLNRPLRALLILIALAAALAGVYVIIQTFGIGGRGLDVRTWIYETALRLFAEKPLTGTGLFTFGAGLSKLNSLPPLEPHSHAHNIILHVAAELGIVGLLALVLTAWVALRALRRPADSIAVMGIAAFAGFVAHQMFDVPAMMPALALVTLGLLVLALPAQETKVLPAQRNAALKALLARWERALPVLIAVGGIVLVLTGLWSAMNYHAYVAALSEGIAMGDYRAAADRLQIIAQSDPALAINDEERGFLLGLASAAGDPQAAQDGANSFRRYVALEPTYAAGWANLAALDEASGNLGEAADAMQQAVALAPQSWSLVYRAGVYAEAAGRTEAARSAYQAAITLNSDIALIAGWDESALRRSLRSSDTVGNVFSGALRLLESGDVSGARLTWEADSTHTLNYSAYHALSALLAQAAGNGAGAQAELQAAQNAVFSPNDRAWVHLSSALLNPDNFDQELAAAHIALEIGPTGSDWELGANIAYIQYLQLAIPRQFLPQVGYSEDDLALLHLLNDADVLAKLRAAVQP
ncbi:MAG: hypothetical protein GC204_10120 [Chloroflexi bacterium]|nr:hypothetical protein [Chloroflexota bacterium]